MTGPGEGKIPLNAVVKLCSKNRCIPIGCDVYLHVKGYSLARVTHIDLEAEVFNEIIKPKERQYCIYKVYDDYISINLRKPAFSNTLNILVRNIRIESKELIETLGSKTVFWVFLGGKNGGIFLGFRKEQVRKLEILAERHGIGPK